jgi:hypothetical protein
MPIRESVLNKAVTGQIVAQDPNDESAAILLKRSQRLGDAFVLMPTLHDSYNTRLRPARKICGLCAGASVRVVNFLHNHWTQELAHASSLRVV